MNKMDIKLENIKNLFKKKKTFRKEGAPINPNLYWRYLLGFVAFVIVASFGFGIYTYYQVVRDALFEPVTSSERERTGQRDRILEMQKYFDKRAAVSEQIKNNKAPVVDPSI